MTCHCKLTRNGSGANALGDAGGARSMRLQALPVVGDPQRVLRCRPCGHFRSRAAPFGSPFRLARRRMAETGTAGEQNSLGLRTTRPVVVLADNLSRTAIAGLAFTIASAREMGWPQRFRPPRLRPGNLFRFGRRPSRLLSGRSDRSTCKARAGAPSAPAACGGARVLALRGCLAQRIGRGGPEQGAVYWEFPGVTHRNGLPPVTAMVAPET